MSTRSKGNKPNLVSHEKKWMKSQDHFNCFTNLIKIELDDELNLVNDRWKTWSKQRLVEAGLTLFDLKARASGRFFGDPILVFESREGGLPYHKFGHGDMVIISRARPWGEKVVEGVVLDTNSRRRRVIVSEKPGDI